MFDRLIQAHPLVFFTVICVLFGLFWFVMLALIPPYPLV